MTMVERVDFAEYPIYSIASDGHFLAASGGGGGSKYGIEDQLEVFALDEKDGELTSLVSSSEAGGVVDSLCYNNNVDLWCGCCNDDILVLKRTDETGFSTVLRFKASPQAEHAGAGKKERLIVTRFSQSGELIVAGGERGVVSVWRVGQVSSAATKKTEEPTTTTTTTTTVSSGSFRPQSPSSGGLGGADTPLSEKANAETTASSPATAAPSSASVPAASFLSTAAASTGEEKWEASLMCELTGHTGDIKDCCVSCDSNLVVSCATDGDLRLWDWKTQRLLHVLSNKANQSQKQKQSLLFRCCRFLPAPVGVVERNGTQRLLAVASSSPRGPSYMRGWSVTYNTSPTADAALASNKKNDDIPAPPHGVTAGSLPGSPTTAAGDDAAGPTVTVKQLCECVCGDGGPCCKAAVSENGMLVALGFADGKAKVFDRGLRVIAQHQRHELPVTGLTFLRNRFLVSSSADYSIVVLNLLKRKRSSFQELRGRLCVSLLLLLLMLLCGLAVHHAASTGYLHFIENNEAVAIGAARDRLLHQLVEASLWQQRRDLELNGDQVQPYVEMDNHQHPEDVDSGTQTQQRRREGEVDGQQEHIADFQGKSARPTAEAKAEEERARRRSGDTSHSRVDPWTHNNEEL